MTCFSVKTMFVCRVLVALGCGGWVDLKDHCAVINISPQPRAFRVQSVSRGTHRQLILFVYHVQVYDVLSVVLGVVSSGADTYSHVIPLDIILR